MKIRKNLEAVFLAAAVMGIFTSLATAEVPAVATVQNAQASAVAADAGMQVVVVKGRRLSAAEKAQLG